MFNLNKLEIKYLIKLHKSIYTNETLEVTFKKILNAIYGKDYETKENLLEFINFTCALQGFLWDNGFFIQSIGISDINKKLNMEYDKRYAT